MELVVDKAGCRYVSLKIAAKIIDIVILVGMNLKETTFSFFKNSPPPLPPEDGDREREDGGPPPEWTTNGHQVWFCQWNLWSTSGA